MKISLTFSLYICRKFLIGLGIVLAILSVVILLSSFLEIIKNASGKSIPISITWQLVWLKYPYLLQKTIPFSMMIGAMFCFASLSKSSELVIARSAGISAWQFMLPVIICAFMIGVVILAFFNPLSSALLGMQEKLLQKYMRGTTHSLAVSNTGLWLREHNDTNNVIVHAKSISGSAVQMQDVVFFILDQHNHFSKRIDAKTAILKDGYWTIKEASITATGVSAQFHQDYKLKTKLVIASLQDSFAAPETISFWELYGFIATLKQAGFSAMKHRLHLYSLLMQPLLLCAMILIAAAFALHTPRKGQNALFIVFGTISGLVIYFFIDLVSALGISGNIPIALSAIAPAMISMLSGIALILHLEDG